MTTNPTAPQDGGEKLAACPFCGGEARLYSISFPMAADCGDVQVCCADCDTIGPSFLFDQSAQSEGDLPDVEAQATAAWNGRTAPALATREGEI